MNTTMPIMSEAEISHFWSGVDIGAKDQCWNWKRSTNTWGYGRAKIQHHMFGSHRIAYYLGNHSDPGRLLVCHKCDNKQCCNPSHLFVGTQSENLYDASRKGKLIYNRGENHGRAKLTVSIIEQIKSLYLQGLSQHKIAHDLSINQSTVSRIISGKRWGHLR